MKRMPVFIDKNCMSETYQLNGGELNQGVVSDQLPSGVNAEPRTGVSHCKNRWYTHNLRLNGWEGTPSDSFC